MPSNPLHEGKKFASHWALKVFQDFRTFQDLNMHENLLILLNHSIEEQGTERVNETKVW